MSDDRLISTGSKLNLRPRNCEGPVAQPFESVSWNDKVTTRGGPQGLSAGRQAHRMAQLHQVLWCHPSDAVPDKKNDLVTYTPLDRQPVQFITDGGRYLAELGNVQNQPRSRVQDRLEKVEEVRNRSIQNSVTVVNPTCNERVNLTGG